MFKYQDGSDVMVGDSVLPEYGCTPGTVEFIVTTAEGMKASNVEGHGVVLESPPFDGIAAPLGLSFTSTNMQSPVRRRCQPKAFLERCAKTAFRLKAHGERHSLNTRACFQ